MTNYVLDCFHHYSYACLLCSDQLSVLLLSVSVLHRWSAIAIVCTSLWWLKIWLFQNSPKHFTHTIYHLCMVAERSA